MKKLVGLTMVLLSMVAAGFAKTVKVSDDKLINLKSITKVADSAGMEVVEDSDNYFVAKSGDDFAFFYKEYYDDGSTIQLACVSLGGTVMSKTIYVEKTDASPVKCSLQEGDKEIRFDDGGNGVYLNGLGRPYYTMVVMNERNSIRKNIVDEKGLVLPAKTKTNDASFRKAYDANIDEINNRFDNNEAQSGTVDLLNKVIKANFASN